MRLSILCAKKAVPVRQFCSKPLYFELLKRIEQISQVTLNEPKIKFFLTQLQKKSNVNDEKYRSKLINDFVNAVYFYNDKIMLTFNSSDLPITVEQSLVDAIEASNKEL